MTPASFLAVDPGRVAGWAYWRLVNSVYTAIGAGIWIDPWEGTALYKGEALLVIEAPHAGRSKATRADLVRMGIRTGTIKALIGATMTVEVQPSQWKGSTPKEISHSCILGTLTPAERAIFDAIKGSKSTKGNALDAIGIGLWYARKVGAR